MTETKPLWVESVMKVGEGQDPLGLQTMTQDRYTPLLLPGILELSRRARYFSFHTFLLDEYRLRRLPADRTALSTFIKRREWDYGLAVLHCPRHCGSVPIGADSLRPLVRRTDPPFRRGESVQTALGGYGLYYRSPLIQLGIVAPAGTPLGGSPITIDVIRDTDPTARGLAETFREAVAHTEYYKHHFMSNEPLPVDILTEYADGGCLCELGTHAAERAAIHAALFDERAEPDDPQREPPTDDEPPDEFDDPQEHDFVTAVVQRRRSIANYLTLLERDPVVASDESAYRESLWSSEEFRSDAHALVAGQWAALAAKDVWQEALCSVWTEFCRTGLALTRTEGNGLRWTEVKELATGMTAGPPALPADQLTTELAEQVASGDQRVNLDDTEVNLADISLEELRQATKRLNTASSGLVTILELERRVATRRQDGFGLASRLASAWQPSLAQVLEGLRGHLATSPTVRETLWWLVDGFILGVHERIAHSKLRESEFTFRFRWEDNVLRFYDNGVGRFRLAAVRNLPLQSLTRDLGFWEPDEGGAAKVTTRGAGFIEEVLQ